MCFFSPFMYVYVDIGMLFGQKNVSWKMYIICVSDH